jgi:hypothetical protein
VTIATVLATLTAAGFGPSQGVAIPTPPHWFAWTPWKTTQGVTNPVLRRELVAPSGTVIQIRELVPPLLTPGSLATFPRRPRGRAFYMVVQHPRPLVGAILDRLRIERRRTKEFREIVAVGRDGRSVAVHPSPTAVDTLFRASPDARPEGGYVRLYLLGPDGLPGIPGRYYLETHAACLGWDQAHATPAGLCSAVEGALRAAFAPAIGLPRFFGAPPTLHRLRNPRLPAALVQGNLRVAFELAFDRSRLAGRGVPPTTCIAFTAVWRGPATRARPTRFCLGARGVYARGRLYPLGRGVWSAAALNLR